jgi:dienelactone hydrolase
MRPQLPRAGQNWIFDNFLKMSEDENVLHPGMLGIRLERGFKYSDMERVFHRVSGRRAFPREWARIAEEQEQRASAALAAGHRVTASQHYHRAALYYGRAQHLIAQDKNPKKITYHAAEIRCYDHVIALFEGAITRHVIPFEDGKQVYCLFHHAPGAGRKPTVLYNPGMDATKEDFPNPFNNEFCRRGMNIVSMDGPGQGECNINGIWLKLGNYARAGRKVIDFLCTQPDVDPDRIGGFGTSMGTRYSVEIASGDPRIKAVIGQMPCVGPSDVIFNQAQPNFKRIHMYMMAMKDEAAFDAAVDEMDKNFLDCGDALTVPYLLVAGDMDELCPVEDVDAWMTRLRCPKELWLYEDVFHPMGEVAADIYPALADWMWDALHKGVPAGCDVRNVFRS